MKTPILLITLITSFLNGQIIQDTLEINQFQTSQIIFPNEDEVELIDVGTGELMVGTKSIGNVVIVQSMVNENEYLPTNLFIKTKNQRYINLYLRFNSKSENQTLIVGNIDIQTEKFTEKIQKTTTTQRNKKNRLTALILEQNDRFKPAADFNSDITLEFYGHYNVNNKIYYKFKLSNNSQLDYYLGNVFVSVRKLKKRKATKTERPLYAKKEITGISNIKGKANNFIIYEFNTFSINKGEEIVFDFKETNNGNRDFKIRIPHYVVNKPIKL